MQFVSTLGIFIFFVLFMLTGVTAVPPGVGTITQLVDVEYPDTVYVGKTYFISASALDISNDPIKDYSCSLKIKKTSTDDVVLRLLVKDWCKEHLTTLPADDVPFACYYTTFSDGSIIMPTYIDPLIFESGVNYTVVLSCGGITTSKTAGVLGVSNHACNVSAVNILDGSDLTVDQFDESPNKFDDLIVPFSLESANISCVGKEVFFKVQKDVNGTYVDFMPFAPVIAGVNGTGTVNFNVGGAFVTDGKYRVVLSVDDQTDYSNFVVDIPRDLFAPKDIQWYRQPIFIAVIIVIIIVGGFVFIKSQ